MENQKKPILYSLRNQLGKWLNSGENEDELVTYFIATIEPQLKQVRGCREVLQKSIQVCRQHCRSIIAKIPGPIHLRCAGGNQDPFIRAAFAQPERIGEILAQANVSSSASALSGNKRFALLTMVSEEKTIFGRKKQGDMVIGDAAMRTINFTDHNIIGLASTLEESRQALEKLCLEIIAEAAARELSEMRMLLVDLQKRRERLRAMHKMFGSSQGVGSVLVPYDPDKHEKQRKLDEMLAETESEIAAASYQKKTPKDWLIIVEDFLANPQNILSMHLVTLRLDWRNVLTDDPQEKAETITFANFTLADEMQRECVLIAYESE